MAACTPATTGRVTPEIQRASSEAKNTAAHKSRRKVARDNTVGYSWRTLQLLPTGAQARYAEKPLEVQERLDGSLVVSYLGQEVPTQEGTERC